MLKKQLGLFLIVAACGCASLRGRADKLMTQGRYQEAADLYDRVLAESPSDQRAKQNREQARYRALLIVIEKETALRRSGQMDEARAELLALLALADRWRPSVGAEQVKSIDNAVAAHKAYIGKQVHEALGQGAPLLGQSELKRQAALFALPAFSDLEQALQSEISLKGQEKCRSLSTTVQPSLPYWTWLVVQACRSWGQSFSPELDLPGQRSDLLVEGAVGGAEEAESRRVIEGLHAWFRETPFYYSRAKEVGKAKLEGSLQVQRENRRVQLKQPWTEQVPYQASESYQVPYQESYLDTEYYSEQVPYTDYHQESYSCGSSRHPRNCTRSVPSTRYRTENRRRMVTKYRTRYRTDYRTVTRYREEPRIFEYEGTEELGNYRGKIVLLVDRGPGAEPFQILTDNKQQFSGITHDVEFTPAGVRPKSAGLPSNTTFFRGEVEHFKQQFLASMNRRYLDLFCSTGRYTSEEASRCCYGLPKELPAGVVETLKESIGPDLSLILGEIKRP